MSRTNTRRALLATTTGLLYSVDSAAASYSQIRGASPINKLFSDVTKCSPQQGAAILHARNESPQVVDEYLEYHHWLHTERMDKAYWTGLLTTPPQDIFTTLTNGDYIFWGFRAGNFEMSAFNSERVHQEFYQINGIGNAWIYQDPNKYNLDEIKNTVTFNDGADYVVFNSLFFDQYQHILIDHLGYLAYLRKTLPPSTKFLLVDVKGPNQYHGTHHGRRLLELLDPEFARRVHWIECGDMHTCNQHIKIRGDGGTLTLVRPPVATRHAQLLAMAREWILSTYPTKPESQVHKKVIYYTRNHPTAQNGRSMDVAQELAMIEMIQQMLIQYNRSEELVIFDGASFSLEQQVDLFQSASIVIGPHGGGLANMLWMLPNSHSADCDDRPKVLEFVTSSATPDVQDGLRWMTYYNIFATCPWVEFHNILYSPGSTRHTTFVDLESFHDALVSLLGNVSRSAVTAM